MLSSVVKNTNFTALKHHKSLREVALEKLITGTIEQGCQSDVIFLCCTMHYRINNNLLFITELKVAATKWHYAHFKF